jgi:hypothetical protein
MKKALMIIMWIILMLVLIRISGRCEKENMKGCYECKLKTTTEYPGQNPRSITITSSFEFCDVTEQYIHFWVLGNTYADTANHIRQTAQCFWK